ncbi:MAG TPA: cupin domain-containing protein [Caulobacteraceae bacterium]|jgi:hypothetical protein
MTARIFIAKAGDEAIYKPAPISSAHVLGGDPVARNSVLFLSHDKLQITLLWHCTAGSFRWFYDEDEICQIIEGGMTLYFDDGAIRVCQAGDTVYFQAGTTCVWVIDKEVRKVAYFREPSPWFFAMPVRALRKLVDKSGLRRFQKTRKTAAVTRPPAAAQPAVV